MTDDEIYERVKDDPEVVAFMAAEILRIERRAQAQVERHKHEVVQKFEEALREGVENIKKRADGRQYKRGFHAGFRMGGIVSAALVVITLLFVNL